MSDIQKCVSDSMITKLSFIIRIYLYLKEAVFLAILVQR